MTEGIIKFKCIKTGEECPDTSDISELNDLRTKLIKLGLMGEESGVGFGNISRRFNRGFIISGSQTGHLLSAGSEDYVIINSYDIKANSVEYTGIRLPSSESLTHAAAYSANPLINFVTHIHSESIWKTNLNLLPTIGSEYLYGTSELAFEIFRRVSTNLQSEGIFLTAGHENGLFVYSEDLNKLSAMIDKLIYTC